MRIGKWFHAAEWTKIAIGQGHVDRLVILEIKYLFCLYFNIWNTIDQERYHNHAFNSISIMLRGWYYETELNVRWPRFIKAISVRFIPRSYTHRVGRSSKNAISITIGGPWSRTWTEISVLNWTVRTLTWGRKVIETQTTGGGSKSSRDEAARFGLPEGWRREWRKDKGIWEHDCPHGLDHVIDDTGKCTISYCDGCCSILKSK